MNNDTLGREQLLWIASESTFATMPGSGSADAFVAADAIAVKTATANATPERVQRDDRGNDNTVDELIELRTSGTWNAAGYLLGGGAATTPPDIDAILANVFGIGSAGGSSYGYRLTTGQENSFSLLADNATNRNHSKTAVGCVVEEFKISGDGTGAVMWEASGPCADVYDLARATANDAMSAGDTAIAVIDAQGIQPGGLLSVASQAGEQLLVTAVDTSTNIITCTRGYGTTSAAAIASGDALVPWSPASQTLASVSPIPGRLGSLTVDGAAIKVKDWSLTLKKNIDFQNDHYGTRIADGFEYPNRIEAVFECTARLRRDLVPLVIGAGKNAKVHNLSLVIGDAVGNTFTIPMPRAKALSMPTIDYPEREVVDVTMSYLLTHTTANSELSLTQN